MCVLVPASVCASLRNLCDISDDLILSLGEYVIQGTILL